MRRERLYFFKAAAFLSACLLFMACEIFFRAAALIFRRGLAAASGACSCGSCRAATGAPFVAVRGVPLIPEFHEFLFDPSLLRFQSFDREFHEPAVLDHKAALLVGV